MLSHGPTCLKGPRSRKRPEWRSAPQEQGIRAELVARVRQEIAAGTYDTPEKMEIALDRLLARLERAD